MADIDFAEKPMESGEGVVDQDPDSVKRFAPEDMIYSNPWNKYAEQTGEAKEPPTTEKPSETANEQTVRRRVRHHYADDGDGASDGETYIGKRHRY